MEALNLNTHKYKHIYLSGPMTGLKNCNFDAFKNATYDLKSKGFKVFDPSTTDGGDTSKPWEYYMRIDIKEVSQCDAVVVLPGWEKSKGAKEEVRVARMLKIPIFSYPSLDYLGVDPLAEQANKFNTQDSKGATKFDDGKARLDLIPTFPLFQLAEVLAYGAKKYTNQEASGEYNWTKGFVWSRTYAALLRHLFSWYSGKDIDKDSGLPHLSHALCNLVFLVEFSKTHKELDDRRKC